MPRQLVRNHLVRRQLLRGVAAAGLAVMLAAVAGCSATPTPTPTPSPTPTPTGDGVLTIGTLFPSSGGVTFIGPAQVAGVNAAVREINAAGGVNGQPVVVVNRDSGDATSQLAEESFAALVAAKVDVIIGPSSSVLAQRLLKPAADAGIPLISPAATFPQLTVLDTAGIFSRTIASYPHQAIVLADVFAQKNVKSVALVYGDDALGTSLSAALVSSLDAAGIDLTAIKVTKDSDAAKIAADVKAAAPDAVVLATLDNGDQTKALITQLSAADFGGAKLWLTTQNLADYSQALPAGLLNTANGILDGASPDAGFQAKVKAEDPGVIDFHYAAEAYDATILAALAAELAHDDGGASISRELQAASVGGIKCTSFGECLDVLTTQSDIDYDGVSGSVNLDENGDVVRGTYGIVVYNGENKYSLVSTRVG
ncbi:MAG: ABC transporter substrate-binding protein [Pseudolysinimonas sp.]|uniref:ABC transporter substrate-binding protein n=1 Tax=Pseudolysinimonas sp. TaxID=2680009 RepID=UPI003262FBCB